MNKRKQRLKSRFGRNAFFIGIISSTIGLIMFKSNIPWIYQTAPELIGFGFLGIIAGIIFIISGRKTKY